MPGGAHPERSGSPAHTGALPSPEHGTQALGVLNGQRASLFAGKLDKGWDSAPAHVSTVAWDADVILLGCPEIKPGEAVIRPFETHAPSPQHGVFIRNLSRDRAHSINNRAQGRALLHVTPGSHG